MDDIDFRHDGINLKVNESGIDYIIGANCIVDRTEAADAAVAELDRGTDIRVVGLVMVRDDWLLKLKPCGLLPSVLLGGARHDIAHLGRAIASKRVWA